MLCSSRALRGAGTTNRSSGLPVELRIRESKLICGGSWNSRRPVGDCGLYAARNTRLATTQSAPGLLVYFAGFGFAYAFYLTNIEAHILQVWCVYCVSSQILSFLIALIVLVTLIFDQIPDIDRLTS